MFDGFFYALFYCLIVTCLCIKLHGVMYQGLYSSYWRLLEPQTLHPCQRSAMICCCFFETYDGIVCYSRLSLIAHSSQFIVTPAVSFHDDMLCHGCHLVTKFSMQRPRFSFRDLWWTKWNWNRFCPSTLVFPCHCHYTCISFICHWQHTVITIGRCH